MININEPHINANVQPDYSKIAQFEKFAFYHNLKEWYVIKSPTDIKVYPDYSLDELGLAGHFAFLIGSTKDTVYIGQAETATLTKVSLNSEGNVINKELIDLAPKVKNTLELSDTAVSLTAGYVSEQGELILGLLIGSNKTPVVGTLINNEYNFFTVNQETGLIITGITKINFYDIESYILFCNKNNSSEISLYSILNTDITKEIPTFNFIYSVSHPNMFAGSNKRYINRQLIWNNNTLLTPSDDKLNLLFLKAQPTKEVYSLESFAEPTSIELTNRSVTQIENIISEDFVQYSKAHVKSNTLTVDEGFQSINIEYGKRALWHTITNSLATTNEHLMSITPLTKNTVLIFGVEETSGNYKSFAAKYNIETSTYIQKEYINYIPMNKFNTGEEYWTGEVREDTTNLLPNAKSISHDKDSSNIDYGDEDFVFDLILDIFIPFDTTLTGQLIYDNFVDDIKIDGVSTGVSYQTNNGGQDVYLISLSITEGKHTIVFTIRNLADPGPGNPTSITLAWDPIKLNQEKVFYNDVYIKDGYAYLVNDAIAKVVNLDNLQVENSFNVEVGPGPTDPENPPLLATGVGNPNTIQWTWLEYFGDLYIYNQTHEDALDNLNTKTFYMWKVVKESIGGAQMFSVFDLETTNAVKLKYFYDGIQELHVAMAKRLSESMSASISTIQYRVSGLANFNQATTASKSVGNILFQDVYVNEKGEVYITEKDKSNADIPPNNINVYVNTGEGGASLSDNDYLVAVDNANNPFNLEGSKLITNYPTSYKENSKDAFSNMLSYIEIPGDYKGKSIVGSNVLREELNNKITPVFGNSSNTSKHLTLSTDEVIIYTSLDIDTYWIYYLIFDQISLNYRLVKGRTVFYTV